MKNADPYEAWKHERREGQVRPGLTDAVMRAVRSEGAPARVRRSPVRPASCRLAAAAAVVAAAGGVTLLRLGWRMAMMLIVAEKGI